MIPNLKTTEPKTITAIGSFNTSLHLTNLFDLLPLFENDDFKFLRLKHEGLMREHADGGVAKASDTEFKNSITIEIEDKLCQKIRAVKVHCAGIHMCGNRSFERIKEMANLITEVISNTDRFVSIGSNSSWETLESDSFYPIMKPVIDSLVPAQSGLDESMKTKLLNLFRKVHDQGGMFEHSYSVSKLSIHSIETVMVNFSYNIEDVILERFRGKKKDDFIISIMDRISEMKSPVFDVYLHYDALSSSMGWSGSVPLKFVHKPTSQVQWLTLQLKRGTVINSGPNVEVMQEAVNFFYEIIL